jgi:predicted small lipoprotein YifL
MLLQRLASVSKMLALLTGCGKKLEIKKGCEFGNFFFLVQMYPFSTAFFLGGCGLKLS